MELKYDVEIYYNGDTMMFTDLMEYTEAKNLFDTVSPSSGAVLVLRTLTYNNNRKYGGTEITMAKDSTGKVTEDYSEYLKMLGEY